MEEAQLGSELDFFLLAPPKTGSRHTGNSVTC